MMGCTGGMLNERKKDNVHPLDRKGNNYARIVLRNSAGTQRKSLLSRLGPKPRRKAKLGQLAIKTRRGNVCLLSQRERGMKIDGAQNRLELKHRRFGIQRPHQNPHPLIWDTLFQNYDTMKHCKRCCALCATMTVTFNNYPNRSDNSCCCTNPSRTNTVVLRPHHGRKSAHRHT